MEMKSIEPHVNANKRPIKHHAKRGTQAPFLAPQRKPGDRASGDQAALTVQEEHQPLMLTSLPGNRVQAFQSAVAVAGCMN